MADLKKKALSHEVYSRASTSRGLPAGVSFAGGLVFDDIRYCTDAGKEILRGVTLSVNPAEILCLLGPSGSGKTTLLRVAAGIEKQTGGRLFLSEREIAGPSVFVPPERRSIGLVFQDYALFPHLTILENVRFGLTQLSYEEGRKEAMITLSRVGMENYAHSYPHILSGGEQQRVALVRALAPRPSVVLMDEPFSGLDSRLRDSVRFETLDILRRSRATAIVVTHDAEEAMRIGDRIALLKDGCLVQVGRPEDLYLRPVDLFTAGFFSELNVFSGMVRGGVVEISAGKIVTDSYSDGTSLMIAIRANGFDLDEHAGETPARVLSRHYLGLFDLFDLGVQGRDKPIRVCARCGLISSEASDIWLTVRRSDVFLFASCSEAL